MTVYKYAILPATTYASEAWSISISKRAKVKLQQIQRSFLIFITKTYRTVSHEALSAIAGIMPIDQAMHLYNDIREISKGQPTNAVIIELKKLEIPIKTWGIHPRDNYIRVDLSGTEGNAIVSIYADGSKTENHVGAGMVAMKTLMKYTLKRQRKKTSSYAINVDSKAALLAIANKHTTHPLAVAIRRKTIELRKSTSVSFHWVKGHERLKGNGGLTTWPK
jgi:ribonuclease HI